jgi:hypothetical protein
MCYLYIYLKQVELRLNIIFLKNTYLFNQNNKINSSLQHITYNQIVENSKKFNINFDNIKIITIVSDLFFFKLITTETTKEEVFDIIDKYLVSTNFDNHNIPQFYN